MTDQDDTCICGEINARNCPVHQGDTKRAPRVWWIGERTLTAEYVNTYSADQLYIHVIEKSAFDLAANTLRQIFDATPCDEWPRPLIMNVRNQLGLDMDWKPK